MNFTTLNDACEAIRGATLRAWCPFEDVTKPEEFEESGTLRLRVADKHVRLAFDCGTPSYAVFVGFVDLKRGFIETMDDALDLVDFCMEDE